MIHFAKGSDSSCSASYEPKCTFTATMNMKCFEAFAAMPKRYDAPAVIKATCSLWCTKV